jgi:hypothetical protein
MTSWMLDKSHTNSRIQPNNLSFKVLTPHEDEPFELGLEIASHDRIEREEPNLLSFGERDITRAHVDLSEKERDPEGVTLAIDDVDSFDRIEVPQPFDSDTDLLEDLALGRLLGSLTFTDTPADKREHTPIRDARRVIAQVEEKITGICMP